MWLKAFINAAHKMTLKKQHIFSQKPSSEFQDKEKLNEDSG